MSVTPPTTIMRVLSILLATLAVASAFVARAPVPVGSHAAVSPAAPVLRTAQLSRAAMPLRMAEEAATESAAPVEDAAACIEDEAIEECTLAEWPAGKLAVRACAPHVAMHARVLVPQSPDQRRCSFQVPMSYVKTAKLGALMFTWFFLNVMYNITNKKCQNAFPMPWTMTFVSLFVGVPYILLLWASGIRKAPKLNPGWWKTLVPIGAAHALGHAGAVIALGAGAVSFAQTVKGACLALAATHAPLALRACLCTFFGRPLYTRHGGRVQARGPPKLLVAPTHTIALLPSPPILLPALSRPSSSSPACQLSLSLSHSRPPLSLRSCRARLHLRSLLPRPRHRLQVSFARRPPF